jgi:hypothetical protein
VLQELVHHLGRDHRDLGCFVQSEHLSIVVLILYGMHKIPYNPTQHCSRVSSYYNAFA